MRIKLITFNDKLNSNDYLPLNIVKTLSKKLEKLKIISIRGECCKEFLEKNILNNDYIFIIDSMVTGVLPGTVMTTAINTHNLKHDIMYTANGTELMQYLKTSRTDVEGMLIGIESGSSLKSLDGICKEVYEIVSTSIKDIKKE